MSIQSIKSIQYIQSIKRKSDISMCYVKGFYKLLSEEQVAEQWIEFACPGKCRGYTKNC